MRCAPRGSIPLNSPSNGNHNAGGLYHEVRLFCSFTLLAANRQRHATGPNTNQRFLMARLRHQRAVSSVNRAYSRDPLERIESIGGVNADRTQWKYSQAAAIARIEAGTDAFFIKTGAHTVKLVVLAHKGEKYLQSEREETHPDDLLHLMVNQGASQENATPPVLTSRRSR